MQEKIKLPEEHVSVLSKVSFSFGSLASSILNGFVFANLTFFYNQKLGADATLLGLAWMLFAIWNTINDPIASYVIDNTRTKLGRRIPYIRYGSIFYGLAFIFCWFPIAPLDNQLALFFNFLAALFILDTMFTIVGCCFFSLPNEIAVTAKERASIGVYLGVISFINMILGIIIPIVLLTGQEGISDMFNITIIIIAVSCSLLLFVTSYYYKENMFAQLQPHEPFVEGLRLTLKNKAFWIYMIPAFCISIVLPIFQTGLLYYVDYIITGMALISFVIALIIGIAIGMALNLKKMAIWGPKKTMSLNLSLISGGFFVLFLFGKNTLMVAVPTFFVGVGFAGAIISAIVIMGDCIDNDELITGKRREAIYGGVNAIVTKPGLSIANWMFLSLLTFFGFVQPIIKNGIAIKQPQSDLGIMAILIAFCLLPAILLGICVLALHWYPLDGPEWIRKKKYIMELHEKKEKEYLQELAKEGKLKT
ncbi:MAG: MFS transporter [Promethearchaeota archaeon]